MPYDKTKEGNPFGEEEEEEEMAPPDEEEMPEVPEEAPLEEAPLEEGAPEGDDKTQMFEDPVEALGQALKEHGSDPAELISWLQEYGFDVVKQGGGLSAVTIGVGMESPEGGMMEPLPEMPESPFDLEGGRRAAAARAMRRQ